MCGGESESQNEVAALMVAVLNGHADCVRLLIDAGADKEATCDVRRRSLLCWAHFLCISPFPFVLPYCTSFLHRHHCVFINISFEWFQL